MASSAGTTGTGTPCGACKFLRRKCASDCIFAPYFCSDQGPARFAAIHKVFGASNVSKLLLHVPVADRCEAVVTIAYEAQARIRDPVYGCVSHIFSLQQQVACLQAQLMQVKAQLCHQNMMGSRNTENQYWPAGNNNITSTSTGEAVPANYNPISSPQSSLDSVDHYSNNNNEGMFTLQETIQSSTREDFSAFQSCSATKKGPNYTSYGDHSGELQALALRMMRN
ncbi:LOB domain-containing protein 16 [Tripterygium wilfordii]|uniref:LOB domain-containing protein 16 n=1 Tax=Tripterygium wilfordii TaxID=458696 RepID=A0A7J7CXV6_TRIWF|nr:LOB domain-containing protein 16 [Tripterygium wilfordii]KAF5738913.1 LOB domain-containing protein 16 [Tripterygium wilfordii]